jgi:hypothetical protein
MGAVALTSSRKFRLALLLATLCALTASTDRSHAARAFETGLTGVYSWGQPDTGKHLAAAGLNLVRIQADWGSIAPDEEPAGWDPTDPGASQYDWTTIDAGVRETVANGMTPLVSINYAPEWAEGCHVPSAETVCEVDLGKFLAFSTAVARRFDGTFAGLPAVHYWQGLNEPNLSQYWQPLYDGNGQLMAGNVFRKLTNAFYATVKAVSPRNIVVLGGLGPISLPPFAVGPMEFARQLLCMKGRSKPRTGPGNCEGGVHFDIFDVHPYTSGGPTHRGGPDDVELGDLGKLQRLIAAADRAGRIKGIYKRTPLWITEFAWDSKPPDPGGLKMKTLDSWVAEAMYRAWKAGISHFFWYGLRDVAHPPGVSYSQTNDGGLYFRGATVAEDRPKPVLQVFRFPFVAYPKNGRLEVWGRTPTSSGGRVKVQARVKGAWRALGTVRAGANGVFLGRLRSTYGRKHRGAVRAVVRGQRSTPFPMNPPKDFPQAPFGNPTG